jgi:hypothetical protein
MNTTTITEIVGVALSQEELLAALLIADLPALPGYENLPTLVFEGLPDSVQPAILAVAERGLVAHGLLEINPNGTVLTDTIRTLLQTATQPEYSWVVLHQPNGQVQKASYFHTRAQQTLAHIEQLGIHQFLQISGTPDIQATILQLVDPVMDTPPLNTAGTLPETTFAALTSGATRPTAEGVRTTLITAGWNSEAAQSFTNTLETLISMTAFARFNHSAQPPLTRAFTLVRGQTSQWAITPAAPGVLKLQAVSGEKVVQALQEFGEIGTS